MNKIINTRQDLDGAPEAEREAFLAKLAGTLHRYDAADNIVTDESVVSRLGFAAADFPDAPVAPYVEPPVEEEEQI